MVDTGMRTGPVDGKHPGVAAIDFDGSRYCITCAAKAIDGETVSVKQGDDWETFDSADGEMVVNDLVSGDIETLGCGGVVLRNSTDGVENQHCCHTNCEHALSADEHEYDHDEEVGVLLDI